MKPFNDKDIEERQKILKEFAENLKKCVPNFEHEVDDDAEEKDTAQKLIDKMLISRAEDIADMFEEGD